MKNTEAKAREKPRMLSREYEGSFTRYLMAIAM
jgi:hypothetical protein